MNDLSLIDTHCHLTLSEHLDIEEHISRARERGVGRILDPGLWVTDFLERYEKLHDYPEVVLGLACAPHYRNNFQKELSSPEVAVENMEEIIASMETILDAYPVVALSEIGLDYFHKVRSPEVQAELFRNQLKLARRRDLPVFLHVRDAYSDAFRLVVESGARRGAVHCFTGDAEDAQKFTEWGFHLSFSGIVTFKQSQAMREIVRNTPDDRILTETDSPFLTPVPLRGKPNEAGNVLFVNRCIAEVKGWTEEYCARQLGENAQELIGV